MNYDNVCTVCHLVRDQCARGAGKMQTRAHPWSVRASWSSGSAEAGINKSYHVIYVMSCILSCHVVMTGGNVCADPSEQEAGCAQGGGAGQGVAGAGRGRRHHRDGVPPAAGGPSPGL